MVLVLVQFAVAALAALGLDQALKPEPRIERSSSSKGDPGSPWMRGALLATAGGFALLVLLNALGPAYRTAAMRSRSGFDEARARAALDIASMDALKGGLLLAAALFVLGLARRGRISRVLASLLVILIAVPISGRSRKIMIRKGEPGRVRREFPRRWRSVPPHRLDPVPRLPAQWNDSLAASALRRCSATTPRSRTLPVVRRRGHPVPRSRC